MFQFFKKRKNYPSFRDMEAYAERDLYFVRIARWSWMNKEMITAYDPNAPRILTFHPWPQIVFLAANGNQTIREFIYYMADQYSGEIPENRDATIIYEINELLKLGLIKLSEINKRPEALFDKAF